MRRILTNALLGSMLILASCKKGEVVQDVNSLGQGTYVTLSKKGNLIVDATNLAGSAVTIDVAEYGAKQEKIIMYVAKGTPTLDRTKWKKLKEVPIADGKYTLATNGQEIATATGVTPAPGDIFTIYNQCVTEDGRTFDIANTFAEFAGNPNYNMALTWQATVVCPFVPAQAEGTYTIIEDGWDGCCGSLGQTATVTATATTGTVTFLFPASDPPGKNPVVIDVDPATGNATVKKQVYGSYGAGFENFSCVGSGFFFACTGFIDLKLQHLLGTSDYGTYALKLKK